MLSATVSIQPTVRPAPTTTKNEPVVEKMVKMWSPRTWWGLFKAQDESVFCSFQADRFVYALLSVLVPVLCLQLLSSSSSVAAMLLSLPSPWVLVHANMALQEMTSFAQTCQKWKTTRMTILPEAIQCWEERLQQGRCVDGSTIGGGSGDQYDLYLPPPPPATTTTTNKKEEEEEQKEALSFPAVILLPGALVPHRAYARVASMLSDCGVIVAVLSMEPMGMAKRHLGADPGRLKRIQQDVLLATAAGMSVSSWGLVGHSLGAFAAMHLLAALSLSERKPSRLVLWGAANLPHTRTNLRHFTSAHVLVVQGGCDGFCHMADPTAFQQDFPPQTRYHTIAGGIHNQFGSYQDGMGQTARISNHQFHQKLTATTARFLHNPRDF